MPYIIKYGLSFLLLLLAPIAYAESELNFAKTVQNPLSFNPEARYITLPFIGYANFAYGNPHHTQEALDLKPVLPFRFTPTYDLILRTIIPFVHQADTNGYMNGLGDINPTLFLSPAKNRVLSWGVGPTLIMPTATHHTLGAGKWSVGPELVLIYMPSRWTFAVLTDNVWSVAGEAKRPAVNTFTFQYYITYNFPHGLYLTTQPQNTANWQAAPSQKWTVPVGGGIGRAFTLGNQKMNFLLQGYYYVLRPTNATHWTLQATFEFLFPDKGVLS